MNSNYPFVQNHLRKPLRGSTSYPELSATHLPSHRSHSTQPHPFISRLSKTSRRWGSRRRRSKVSQLRRITSMIPQTQRRGTRTSELNPANPDSRSRRVWVSCLKGSTTEEVKAQRMLGILERSPGSTRGMTEANAQEGYIS